MSLKHIFSFLAFAAAVNACSSLDCSINSQVNCAYGIQDANGNDSTLASGDTLTISTKKYARATDETATLDTIINKLTSTNNFTLQMGEASETDVLYMTLTRGVITTYYDTVYITKTNEPTFESVDCTPRFNHTITAIKSSHHFIDSIHINKAQVTNDASTKNLYLRLRKDN